MVIKFKQDITYKNKPYFKDDVLEDIKKEDMDSIWKLNEKGYIYPITYKEFIKFKNELSKEKIKKEG